MANTVKTNHKTSTVKDMGDSAETMRGFGRLVGKAGPAKLNAHIYFGAQVKAGIAKVEDAPTYAKWYDEGACEVDTDRTPMTPESLKVTAANFAGFANPEVLKLENPYANIAAFMKGKSRKELGKDSFGMHVAVNKIIKDAAATGKPITAVNESAIAAKVKGKPKVELTPKQIVDATKQELVDTAQELRDVKGLSSRQKDALIELIAAFGKPKTK